MMKRDKTLQELFSFSGFKAAKRLAGKFGDPKARIIILTRQKKLLNVLAAARSTRLVMIVKFVKHGIWMRQITESMCVMNDGVYRVLGAKVCE